MTVCVNIYLVFFVPDTVFHVLLLYYFVFAVVVMSPEQIVPAADLRSAYRALKRTAERDADEATRSHAANALSDLDVVIRGQLFPAGGGKGVSGTMEHGRGENGEEASPTPAHHPGITVL